MRVLVINPVGHPTWDEQDKKIYQSFASKDVEVDVRSLPKGPKSVESVEAYAEVVPIVLKMLKENKDLYDGFIINCFLDPGVELSRSVTSKPVIGPCKASMSLASFLSRKVGVVTVGNEALWLIKERIRYWGYEDILVGIEGTGFGVLDIDEDKERTLRELVDKSLKLRKKGAEIIVLGCTGLAGLAQEVQKRTGIPTIDPAGASMKLLEALIRLNLSVS